MVGVFLAILLALCWLSHRYVESPMQRQGRRLSGWLDTWLGPDTLPAVPASPSATPSHKAIAPHMPPSTHEPPPSRESSETAAA